MNTNMAYEVGTIIHNPKEVRDYIVSLDPLTGKTKLIPFTDDDNTEEVVLMSQESTKKSLNEFKAFTKTILDNLKYCVETVDIDDEIMDIILKMYIEYKATNKNYYS